jgi:outer membrane protein assembly factor BamB
LSGQDLKTVNLSSNRTFKQLLLTLAFALLALTFVFAGGASAADHSSTQTGSNITVDGSVVASDKPDPPADTLGWENGVWANATLSIDQSDGIGQDELEAVVARTMARVETVREIEFDRTPPVRVIPQQKQREEAGETTYNDTQRTLLNAQYESLFLINESRDATESMRVLLESGVNGYYSTEARNVTIISPNASVPQIREGVLAQELFHAQQDNQFDLPEVETIEERNTRNGYVEGDANYVQELYEKHCEGMWSGTCYRPERSSAPDLSGLNDGMLRLFQQPYQSGYEFVRDRYQKQGWEAVNRLYERPPVSTEQVIHPKKYPADQPTNLTVTDRSSDAWQPLRAGGERVTGSVGEAGLYVSMVYPALQTNGQREIIPEQSHFVGGFGDPVQLGYDHKLTAGWDGDRLLPYVSSDGNKTGYVYETVWDSRSDAREFHRAYRELLAYHDAEPVDGLANTYRIPTSDGFSDAFYVERDADRFRIVNAPSVQSLTSVDTGAAPSANSSHSTAPWQRVDRTWQTELPGRGVSSSTVANGRIYFTEFGGTVRAVNKATGEFAWVKQVNGTVTSAPAVANGTVYAGTTRATVIALNARSGEVQWRQTVNGSMIATPTVTDRSVYVGTTKGTVIAFDGATGEKRWTKSTGGPVGTRLGITDGNVYATNRSGVFAISQSTGEGAWNVTVDGSVLTAPTVRGETVYATSLDIRTGVSRIHAVDADDGTERWTQAVNGTAGTLLTVAEDTVYVGGRGISDRSGSLSAFDRQHGDRLWRLNFNESVNARPVTSNGTVYVGTGSGRVYSVEGDSGDRQFMTDVDGAISEPIIASNDTLYVGSDGGSLYAINGSTGTQEWTFMADGLAGTRPILIDNQVYAQTESTLYRLERVLTASDSGDGGQSGGSSGGVPDSDDEPTQSQTNTDDTGSTEPPDSEDDMTVTGDAGSRLGLIAIAGIILIGAILLAVRQRR